MAGKQQATLEVRLWRKIDRRADAACWPWTASRNRYGYGQIQSEDRSRPLLAHRVVYSLACGEIPAGMCVMHTCDNPACCNPKHLQIGTQADNIADMNAKGRNGNVGRPMTAGAIAKRRETNRRNALQGDATWLPR